MVLTDCDPRGHFSSPYIQQIILYLYITPIARKLESEKYQQDIGKGISEGILKFVDEHRADIIKDRINYR